MPRGDVTFLGRIRTHLWVRAAVRSDDARAEAILGRLEGRMSRPNPAGIAFTSCNERYFRPYALHFVRSVLRYSPDQGCHLHLVDSEDETLALAGGLRSGGGT